MKIAWFTPFSNSSAIGKVSNKICQELQKTAAVDIWTYDREKLIETNLNIMFYNQNTEADTLNSYDFIIYNMGNFAGNHRYIYEMSQKKPGIVIIHDQTMHSFWGQYYLMPEFGGDSNLGFEAFRSMYREYYGEKGEACAIEAYQSGHYPIYDYKTMPDFKLIEPLVQNAIGVFTHARFFTDIIKGFYNGPVGFTYLPSEIEKTYVNSKGIVGEIIRKARENNRLILLSNGIVHPVKHIDKVANVLLNNKILSQKICYIVIGSYGGAYGESLEQLSNNKLKDCLYMCGYQNDDEMFYALQNTDICINLRYPNSEVCSLSLLEQMTYGKPTVVINSGIYGEMKDDCVVKISVDNEEKDLENALIDIINNKAIYDDYGKKAQQFIQKHCSIKAYSENFIDFLNQLNINQSVAKLQNGLINEVGYILNSYGFRDNMVPSTIRNVINQLSGLFNKSEHKNKSQKVIGIWAGFLYKIPNLKREGITRFIVYMIDSLIKNYSINVEVWSYSFNEEELRDSFTFIQSDQTYMNHIKIITEKNWDSFFIPNPQSLSFGVEINEIEDNLCDLARDYSNADCFIPMILYLDNVLGVEKPIYVPAHDMAVAHHYYDFIIKDPLYKFRSLDITSRVENLARNGAVVFSNCNTVRQTQILKYIKNLREDNTAVIYLPVNIPEGIEDNIIAEEFIRNKYKISGRYLFYPTQIRPYKNVSTLIEAFHLLVDEYQDLSLVLTGNPSDVPEVNALIKKYRMDNRIKLISSVSEIELYSIYKYASAVPVTSIFEGGFPWQACEALFMQVPLVLANIPIVEERIIYHKMTLENCGLLLYDPLNASELAVELQKALEDKEKVVKKQSLFRYALLSYDWNTAAKNYYNLFFPNETEEAVFV